MDLRRPILDLAVFDLAVLDSGAADFGVLGLARRAGDFDAGGFDAAVFAAPDFGAAFRALPPDAEDEDDFPRAITTIPVSKPKPARNRHRRLNQSMRYILYHTENKYGKDKLKKLREVTLRNTHLMLGTMTHCLGIKAVELSTRLINRLNTGINFASWLKVFPATPRRPTPLRKIGPGRRYRVAPRKVSISEASISEDPVMLHL